MKENLKQDICRISEIMGVSNILIVESSGPGDDFLKFIRYLAFKIGDTKLGSGARDILKNKVDDLQKLNNISKDEAEKLKKIFDADDFEKLARKSNTVEDFVNNLGKNYDGKEIIRKLVNQIPETQIKKMTLDLVNNIIEKNEKALQIYEIFSKKTISGLEEKLVTDPNFINKSLDEIYDYIKLADTQGIFTDYSEVLDNFRSRFKNDPKLEKFLKDHPELLNDADKVKFIDDTPKLADGILADMKDKNLIEKLVREFKNFYINNLEPYSRWYLDWIRNVFFKFKLSPEATANKAINEFNEKMKMGFDAYRAKGPGQGQNINNAYVRQVLNDLAKLPTRLNNNINPNLTDEKSLQGLLWDEYKKNAKKQLGENSDQYKKLLEYMTYVEQKKFKYDKTLCWRELCTFDKRLSEVAPELLEQVSTLTKNVKGFNFKTFFAPLKKKFHNILSLVFSGNFKTPAEYTRFVMKNTPKSQKRALTNIITVEGFGTKRVISFMAQSYLLSSVLIPAMVSIVVQIIDLIRESFGGKETRYYVKDREYSNNFAINIIINAFIDGVLNTPFLDLIYGSKEFDPWYDGYIKDLPLPGSFDQVLIYFAIKGQKLSESIRGKSSETEKTVEDAKKIQNKTNTLKKIKELAKLPKNKLHQNIITYLNSPHVLNHVIPNQKLRVLYIKLLKSEGEKVFLINSTDNKKYELIKNASWNKNTDQDDALELNSQIFVYNGKNGPQMITALDPIFEPLIELSEPIPVKPPNVSDELKKATSNTNENVLDYLVFKIKKQLIYEQYERKIRRG